MSNIDSFLGEEKEGRGGRGKKTKVRRLTELTRVFKISHAISLLSLLNSQTVPVLYRSFSRDSERLFPGNCGFNRVIIIIRVVTLPRMVQHGDVARRSCLSDSTLYHLGISFLLLADGIGWHSVITSLSHTNYPGSCALRLLNLHLNHIGPLQGSPHQTLSESEEI